MAARAALLALASVSSVLGFSNTVPFVAWSSQRCELLLLHFTGLLNTNLRSSNALDSYSPSTRPDHSSLLESITKHENICLFDAIFVIDHPGVSPCSV